MHKFRRYRPMVVFIVSMAFAWALMPALTSAANANPHILPPNSQPHGQSYGEWSADWWQWVAAQPASVNPLLDATGEFCAQGQNGKVWFLAGTFDGSATRTCTIPRGTALFFPIVNIAYIGFPSLPEDTEELARQVATEYMNDTLAQANLTAQIDGIAIENLANYRAASPIFDVTLPQEDNLFGVTTDDCTANANNQIVCGPSAADGIYLMLAPLAKGDHEIHFSLENGVDGFALDVTYKITVR